MSMNQLTAVKTRYQLTSSTWPYQGLRCRPIEVEYFLEVIRCQVISFQLLRFWFLTNLGSENSASYLELQAGKTFSYQGHSLVTIYVQFLCSDWSKFDRRVHAENLCSILKLVYFDSWSWQSFESTCDVFNCLFPLDIQNEIQLLSRVFCYSWLVFFIGFLVERCVACQSRKSDFGWHLFCFSPCVML